MDLICISQVRRSAIELNVYGSNFPRAKGSFLAFFLVLKSE